jgi:hypothetical protein
MKAMRLNILVLATATVCFPGQPPATTANGVFLGKSGKPMAGARLILCEVLEDQGKVRPVPNVPAATADPQGRFTLRGFQPGRWTMIYLLPGVNTAAPNEIDISPLEAVDKSILPLMVRVELGTDAPYAPRPWTRQFTLLKGHTFWSMGQQMKIWNATVRRGAQGPYLELRRGRLWLENFADKGQFKIDAWSF